VSPLHERLTLAAVHERLKDVGVDAPTEPQPSLGCASGDAGCEANGGIPSICAITPDASPCKGVRAINGPRCLATDPQCGPEFAPYVSDLSNPPPVWHGPHGETGDMCLRPDAPRYPTFAGLAQRVDACRDDGECVVMGCGDVCFSYARPRALCHGGGPLREYKLPADAAPLPPRWCGCVDGRCTLFTQ